MNHPNLVLFQVKQFQQKLYKNSQITQVPHAINFTPQAPPTKVCLGALSAVILRLT
jgi:hypothetical protein